MGVGGSVMWRKGREGGSADKKGEGSARPLSSIPAWVSKAKQVEQQTRQGSALLLGPFHILLALSSDSIQLRAGIELVKAFVGRGCTTKAAAALWTR